MKLTILSVIISAACAFSPSVPRSAILSSLSMSSNPEEPTISTTIGEETGGEPIPAVSAINGWVADASKPCFGLPGAISPLGFFDPLGFTKDKVRLTETLTRYTKLLGGSLVESEFVQSSSDNFKYRRRCALHPFAYLVHTFFYFSPKAPSTNLN